MPCSKSKSARKGCRAVRERCFRRGAQKLAPIVREPDEGFRGMGNRVYIRRKLTEFDRMTVQELEKAVAKLSPEELAEFRAWFQQFDMDEWDRQIARGSESGRLDKFAEEAIAGYKAGRVKEL